MAVQPPLPRHLRFGVRAEAAVVRAALALLRALGPAAASTVCGRVARLIGPLLPVSRVAHGNLRRAMPELDDAARRRIVRGVWENLGRTVGELPNIPALRRTAAGPGWEVVGEDTLSAVVARGGPAIFVTGHIGNWEILPPVAAAYGMNASLMYRASANPLIDRIIVDLRQQAMMAFGGKAMPMFPKGAAGARDALRHLSRGGFMGMLMDQKMNDGIPARFFGRTAMTAPALAAMALRFRCPVIPILTERLGPARLRLVCEPPLDLPDTGDRHADIATLTQAVNDRLERWIRARPESWLWLHRRWPRNEG